MSCLFCDRVATGHVLAQNDLAVAFYDAFPLNPGHTLIVPRRHEADFLALTADEQADIWSLVSIVRNVLEGGSERPDGYNIGINVGEAAGQTIGHAHLHVIPRYVGDVPDPRGGLRWVLPARAAYWAP